MRHFTSARTGIVSVAAAFAAVAFPVAARGASYNVDFGGSPVASGFAGAAPAHFHTLEAESFAVGPYTLSFASVDNYSTGNANNPLVTDGLFSTTSSAFTLSGLSAGDQVTLYAIDAWDGAGRAAFVSFGGSAFADTAAANDNPGTGAPGLSPTVSDFVLVAQNVSPIGGAITGSVAATNGTTTRAEGQLGGLIIQVTSVPEPASLSAVGVVGCAMLRRRRRAATRSL